MSSQPMRTPPPAPMTIWDAFGAYQRTEALKAGIELGLFTAIAEGANTVEALTKKLSASQRGVRILSDFLTIMGLLSKQGETYQLTPESSFYLDQRSPAYLGGAARFLLSDTLQGSFRDLAGTVRAGRTPLEGEGTVTEENPIWVDFARGMLPLMMPMAQIMAAKFAGTGPIEVLDVAAGHGIFGVSMAMNNPQAKITALDWGSVLAVARETAEAMGVADRMKYIPGDAFTVELDGPYDLVLITNFLHHFSPSKNEEFLKRIRQVLKPGGTCVTLDFVPSADRVNPPPAGAFALVMLASTAEGDAYTLPEYERMFKSAGFGQNELVPLPDMPCSLVVSR